MEAERIRKIVAARLSAYRKRAGLTQVELAEKVNYSDKSVSKWERGDGLPDLLVLCKLAELYEIPVDEFLHEGPLKRPASEQRRRHWLIFLLSVGLTFLIAGIVFYIFTVLSIPYAWLSFVCAVVVSTILAVIFSHIWAKTLLQCISVSALVWSLAVLIYLLLYLFAASLSGNGLLFSLAGGMQILVLLWYLLQHYRKKNKKGI
ncbi:MAG: helix-turn-helix domain-containing protein [Clostridia bacterium]|jgi:transcriptional regulator with XRE-family HTH domain|nr:helix-turn-helix domain-containing protein [Clostridia bacterium]